jgi:fatty acid desaturase
MAVGAVGAGADRAGAIDRERLRALSVRSDLKGWVQTGSHSAAIAATGAALWMLRATWWAVPLFVVQGVLINWLYAGQHEFSHSTVFRTRRLNELFGRLIGFILITPRDADQIQHFAHHRHTQVWRQDGELFRARFTLRGYLVRLSGLEYWWSNVQSLVLYAFGVVGERYVKGDDVGRVVGEARWHLVGYAAIAAVSLALQSWAAVILWLGPLLAMKAAHQLQNLIEHVGLPHSGDIFGNTRSVRTNAVMRWLGWNMQYHTAHHAFPAVPFHHLPELHRALFDERGIEPPTMTYLGFQAAILKALARKGEAEYPDDAAWVTARAETTPSLRG